MCSCHLNGHGFMTVTRMKLEGSAPLSRPAMSGMPAIAASRSFVLEKIYGQRRCRF
jgi:hypothetical protein